MYRMSESYTMDELFEFYFLNLFSLIFESQLERCLEIIKTHFRVRTNYFYKIFLLLKKC